MSLLSKVMHAFGYQLPCKHSLIPPEFDKEAQETKAVVASIYDQAREKKHSSFNRAAVVDALLEDVTRRTNRRHAP